MAERQISFERGRATTFEIGVAASTTGAAITGKAKADFNISKDGAAFAALNASSTVTEIANGFYKVVLDATTDATCDRFVLAYITAGGMVCAVIGQSQWEFSKIRIESTVDTASGGYGTDAPLYIYNNSTVTGACSVLVDYSNSNGNLNAGIRLRSQNGFGSGLQFRSATHGVYFDSVTRPIRADWCTGSFLYFTGTPGSTGGKLVEWATLGGTAPVGPLIDFGASITAAKLIDWTSTPASSAPVIRITAGGAGAALELDNSSTGPAVKIANSSSGDSVQVSAAGAGSAFKVSNSSTGNALDVSAAGAGSAAKIANSSSGNAVNLSASGAGYGLYVENTSTADAVRFVAAGASAYALNLDMGTAAAFGMRIDAAGWPEITGTLASLDFFGAMGRMLADQFNVHTLNKDTQVQTTTKRDGTTSLQTRALADDGTTQTVGAVS